MEASRHTHGTPVPSLSDWRRLWQLWDAATLHMVPAGSHLARPLEQRHALIFYVGHTPAFADARLARVLGHPLSEPAAFANMFARGIDPDLDTGRTGHAHSPVPDAWAPLADVLRYRDRVRGRILQLYGATSTSSPSSSSPSSTSNPSTSTSTSSSVRMAGAGTTTNTISSMSGSCSPQAASTRQGGATSPLAPPEAELQPDMQHVLWMAFEHEAMHLETLLYLLVQYPAVLPPPAALVPPTHPAAWHSQLLLLLLQEQQQRQTAQQQLHAPPQTASSAAGAPLTAGSGGSSLTAAQGCQVPVLPLPPPAVLVDVPGAEITLGFDKAPSGTTHGAGATAALDSGAGTHSSSSGSDGAAASGPLGALRFGWDNESPSRCTAVPGFRMQHRPVTALEYVWFLAHALVQELELEPELCAPAGVPLPSAPATGSEGTRVLEASDGSSSSSAATATSLPEVLRACAAHRGHLCARCRAVLQPLLSGGPARLRSLLPLSLMVAPSAPHLEFGGGAAAQTRESDAACTGAGEAGVALAGAAAAAGAADAACSRVVPGSVCSGLCTLMDVASGGTCGRADLAPAGAGSPPGWTLRAAAATCQVLNTHACAAAAAAAAAGLPSAPPVPPKASGSSTDAEAGHAADGSAGEPTPAGSAQQGAAAAAAAALLGAVFAALQQLLCVKSVFGPVPLSISGYWPVYCSSLQAGSYAEWWSSRCAVHSGGSSFDSSSSSSSNNSSFRLPTEPELLLAWQHSGCAAGGRSDAPVCSHSLQPAAADDGPSDFAVWHPVCVPISPKRSSSRSHDTSSISRDSICSRHPGAAPAGVLVSQLRGNGWEWSSTPFSRHEGFEPHPLYPEYSQDFFGGKHAVLLGASWATLGAIAARSTYRNWYQQGQQHVFAKFRLVTACESLEPAGQAEATP